MPTPTHTILASSSTQQLSLENATNSEQQCIQSSCSAGGVQSSTSLEASTPPMLDMLPTPVAIALLEGSFSDPMEKKHLHSFFTCCGKCSDVSDAERAWIKSQKKKTREGKRKGVDMFKHSWLSDRKTSFCDKTGKYKWKILYIIMMFAIISSVLLFTKTTMHLFWFYF